MGKSLRISTETAPILFCLEIEWKFLNHFLKTIIGLLFHFTPQKCHDVRRNTWFYTAKYHFDRITTISYCSSKNERFKEECLMQKVETSFNKPKTGQVGASLNAKSVPGDVVLVVLVE